MYFRSVGVAGEGDIRKVFGWGKAQIHETLTRLGDEGELIELNNSLWATSQFAKDS
jgi:hypothetical protein